MIRERWNRLFGTGEDPPVGGTPASIHRESTGVPASDLARHSSALEQYFQAIQGQYGLAVLDLGPISQENTDFFNALGHNLRCDNFIRSLDESFAGDGGFYANQEEDDRIQVFQSKVLNYDDETLDGILVWDALQYLAPNLLEPCIEQMHSILRPGGQMLTVFHMEEKALEVPSFSYRIQGRNRVRLVSPTSRRPARYFTTRALEQLFKDFSQVKFFLTQDSLREVIIRK